LRGKEKAARWSTIRKKGRVFKREEGGARFKLFFERERKLAAKKKTASWIYLAGEKKKPCPENRHKKNPIFKYKGEKWWRGRNWAGPW